MDDEVCKIFFKVIILFKSNQFNLIKNVFVLECMKESFLIACKMVMINFEENFNL